MMKKCVLLILSLVLTGTISFAQLTGVKTIPGTYPTVSAAITDLNTLGVGPGGVTFNVAAGYTETFGSLTAGLITTTTGSVSNPIVFQKSGAGANPVITGYATAPGSTDYIIAVAGTDYITFNGIDVTETTGVIEWGYAILKASATDGSQNVTIKNCTITMNKTFPATVGIYSNNVTPAAPTTQLTVTAVTGANSGNKFYSNTIANCYTGIYVYGYNDANAPYAYFDQNNEIGKDGANIITNVGGLAANGYGIYTIYQNNLKVANNNVTSTMAGTGTFYGIYMTNSKNGSYDLYGNTVSIQFSGTGTSSLYAIYADMGASATNNTVNVYNNTVTNCTFPTVTSSSQYFYGIYLANSGVTTNVYGNVVSNNTYGASGVIATGRTYYLWCNMTTSTAGALSYHDNSVTGNTRIQSVPGTGATQFINASGLAASLNYYNNTVANNIVASNGGTYCLNVSTDVAIRNVYNNTVSNISKAEGTTYGLYLYNVTSNSGVSNVYMNSVSNIEGLTAGANMYGCYVSSSSGIATNIYNNMIYDLRTPAGLSGASSYNTLNGIYISGGSPIGIYNNTVYLNASSTAANFGSTALYLNTSALLDSRNNILVNNSVPSGLGKTVALRLSSTTNSALQPLSNYDDFYAGTPGASNVLCYDGTTGDQTLLAVKTRLLNRELQSVTELPPFINVAATPFNVHLNSAVATQCEAGGSVVSSPVAITTDFDSQSRFPNAGYPVGSTIPNAPDMGADEFGGAAIDITGPSIVYTPLQNYYNGNPRTITAVITDGHNVPVSGAGLPVLYWKVNSGAYQAAQGTYVSGNTYSFTFGAGAVVGDIVSYYIAAQDMASTPNTGTYPWIGAAGYSVNPPACSAPPTGPSSYMIIAGISGVFHVGLGKDYTSLTAAANDINAKYINGPLTLILDDATYSLESFPITFTPNPGSSPVNTLTIKPNTGVNAVFTMSIVTGILNIIGFDYLIIDGSNNGTNSRNLTFENALVQANTYVISVLNSGASDPSTNVTIRNCRIKGATNIGSVVINSVIQFTSTIGSHDNWVLDNNIISSAYYGIKLFGSATGILHNCQITNNTIGSLSDPDAINNMGIYMQYDDNTLISGNEIMGPASGNLTTGQTGVYMGTGVTNTKVRSNKIHSFYHTADDGWGVSGIWYASDATTVTEISDNVLYDIKAPGINPGVGQNITYGIFVRSGGNVKILHNAISLTGPYLSSQYDASSSCIGFYYQATGGNFEVRDNILRNSMTYMGTVSPLGRTYGIAVSLPASSMFSVINNNDYWIDGANPTIGQQYTNGTGAQVQFYTLADWQAFTGQEANSLTVDPVFSTPSFLKPTTALMPHAGAYLTLVPTDITGVNRTNPPDIGAYEFTTDPIINTVAASGVTNSVSNLNGSANATGTTFNLFFDWGLTTAYGNIASASPSSVSGNSLNTMTANLSGLTGFTTYHYRARGVTTGGLTVYGNDMTFTTAPNAPTVVTTAATSVTSSSATLNGTVNANGGTATVTFDYGLTTAYGTTINATPNSVTGLAVNNVSAIIAGLLPNQLYHYRVNGVNVTGTTNGNDMTFTTVAIVPIVVTNFASGVGSTTATLNGTVTANNASTSVTFQYGLTTGYGSTINATPAVVNGMTASAVLASLSGLTINTTYHFRCVGVNVAGTINGADQTFTTNCVAPVITISGPATGCSGTAGYVYTTQTGMTGYTWNISAGGTITSGAGTSSITVTWNNTGAQFVNVNYNNQYGCSAGAPLSYPVTVNASPVPVITGPATGCVSFTSNFTTQTGMSSYTWTVSTGGAITAGQGTSAVTITWSTTGVKTVTVNYANASGCLAPTATVFTVTVNGLPAPTITGTTSVCANSGYIPYSTEAGMTGYNWTVSAGGTISAGGGTNTIQVTWTGTGVQTVSVNYNNANGCSAVNPTVLNVTVNGIPGAAGTITGTPVVCGGTQGVAYSCATINGALTYVWTLPAGATIAAGSGTNAITVNFAANASSGDITVFGNNLCGNGAMSPNFPVTVTAIPAPAGTISGPADVCQSTSGVVYTVAQITDATGYTWTLPAGATIVSGSNSNTITVDFSSVAVSGIITVTGTNSCGNGTVSPNFTVTVNAVPSAPVIINTGYTLSSDAPAGNQWYFEGTLIAGATTQTYLATQTGYYWDVVTLNGCSSDTSNHKLVVVTGIDSHSSDAITVYPVPNNGRFTVSIRSKSTEPFTISVFTNLGVMVYEVKDIRITGQTDQLIDLNPAVNGIYTVVIRTSNFQMMKKIVVNK